MPDETLFDRLGGAYAIATVVDHFSEATAKLAGDSTNPALRGANDRVPIAGLKFLRTLFFCEATGGPYSYTARPLDEAHKDLAITPAEFDEVQAELGRSLDHFNVPEREKNEVLALFAAGRPAIATG